MPAVIYMRPWPHRESTYRIMKRLLLWYNQENQDSDGTTGTIQLRQPGRSHSHGSRKRITKRHYYCLRAHISIPRRFSRICGRITNSKVGGSALNPITRFTNVQLSKG